VICVVTGHYTSVKFDWCLIVDQSLTGDGEMNLLLTGEENWRLGFTCVGETGPYRFLLRLCATAAGVGLHVLWLLRFLPRDAL